MELTINKDSIYMRNKEEQETGCFIDIQGLFSLQGPFLNDKRTPFKPHQVITKLMKKNYRANFQYWL